MSPHSRIGVQSWILPKSHLKGVPGKAETQLSQKTFLGALAEGSSLPGMALLTLCWRLTESQVGCDLQHLHHELCSFFKPLPWAPVIAHDPYWPMVSKPILHVSKQVSSTRHREPGI